MSAPKQPGIVFDRSGRPWMTVDAPLDGHDAWCDPAQRVVMVERRLDEHDRAEAIRQVLAVVDGRPEAAPDAVWPRPTLRVVP